MSRRALALAALLALAAGVAGCRTPGPGLEPVEPGDPRPQRFVDALRERVQARRAVRGRAKVSLSGRTGEGFTKQVLVVERPARLRVEVIGLMGQRVAVLATDGERYQLFRTETGRIEAGEVTPDILARVAGMPLSPRQAVNVLLGAPAPPPGELGPGRAAAREDGGVRVELDAAEGAGLVRTLTFDAQGRLRRWLLRDGEAGGDAESGIVLEVRYDDYRELGGEPFAHRVAVAFPPSGAHAELSFQDAELNPTLPEGIFRLAPARAHTAPARKGGG